MGYQTKTFRKFVATSVTATLVATAVAPLASAAAFTDVKAEYREAVNYVHSKGVQGFSETEFGVYQPIKRVDAAVMLVKVLGLNINSAPASGFKDVPKRAVKYINALKAAGITNGTGPTTFNANGLITRGELAVWIQRAYGFKGTSTISFTDVPSSIKPAVTALVDYGITKGITSTRFGTEQNAKRGDFANFLLRASKAEKVEPEVPSIPEEISILSAKVISDSQVEVNFSADVDSADVDNFTINGAKVTAVKLSNNKKTATLTVSGLEYDTSYTVRVKGIKRNGVIQFGLSATFKTNPATNVWSLSITSKPGTLTANRATHTELTFQLVNKTTGQVDRNANNIDLELAKSYGSLAKTKVTIRNGEATVILTTPPVNQNLTSTISAKVVDAPSEYKALINTLTGSINVPISATSSISDNTPFTIKDVKGYFNGNNSDTIEITFSEGVQYNGESSDATNRLQYTLYGQALPTSTSITYKDSNNNYNDGYDTVVLTLPDNTLSKTINTSHILSVNKEMFSYDYSLISGVTDKYFYVQDTTSNNNNLNEAGTYWGDVNVYPTGSSYTTYGPSSGLRTVNGNVTIDGNASSYITLRNIRINGNLTINTPNASVILDSSVVVTGTTTIQDVASNTFTNRGQLGTVYIQDGNGTRFVNEYGGSVGTVNINTYGTVTLDGNIPNVNVNQTSTLYVTGNITNLQVYAPVTINGNGKISTIGGSHTGYISGNNPHIPNANDRTRAINEFNTEKNRISRDYTADKSYLYTESTWNALQYALSYALNFDVNNSAVWEINNVKNSLIQAETNLVRKDQGLESARSLLRTTIATANNLLSTAVEGDKAGEYLLGSKSTLEQAKNIADSYANNSNNLYELTNANTDLDAAIRTFEAQKVTDAQISKAKQDLQASILSAQSIFENNKDKPEHKDYLQKLSEAINKGDALLQDSSPSLSALQNVKKEIDDVVSVFPQS
ncbi:S-layer homology domain-containing protein [Bacillus sp. JJ722]|uniref:S-layer homology domain-containing protein n=1 Tax=Bacillus sp. JJ722 TaxID=3122973 RepID=UPI002FFF7336